MVPLRLSLAAALAFAAACSKPADNAADSTRSAAADTSVGGAAASAAPAAAAASDAASPTAAIVVLYNEPKDTAAFEKYYRETHLPLVRSRAAEIGLSRAIFTKFDRTADGKKPPYYREAQLWFASEDALEKGMASAGFKAVGADFPNFVATGGTTILISHETNKQ